MASVLIQFDAIQFNFIYIVYIKIQIVSRIFPETQIMIPEQISLTKVIILNPNQRKTVARKTSTRRKKPGPRTGS